MAKRKMWRSVLTASLLGDGGGCGAAPAAAALFVLLLGLVVLLLGLAGLHVPFLRQQEKVPSRGVNNLSIIE